ncbi:MAG: AAA family ATPase, partial [Sandaracinaceae bacterium]|nr:AAA family ATPase [Sandaracinaceae bacterium]
MGRRAGEGVDRERELAQLRALAEDGWGWIAVVGPAGVGKSAFGARAPDALGLPAVTVSLRGSVEPRALLGAIAGELQLGDASEAAVAAALRARSPCMLVLDDADEALVELGPVLARMTASAREALVLGLSRRRPAHAGAVVIELGPLALDAGAGEEPPALTLFAARLAAQRGGRPLEPS